MLRIVIFFLSINLIAVDIPEIIKKGSIEYERERKLIKNYKVVQDIVSELKSGGILRTEKRKQVGYFVAPNRYFFFPKEKYINQVASPIAPNEVEKSTKKEIEWISSKGLERYDFKLLDEGNNHYHFSVSPRYDFPEATRGEIWVYKDSGKIIRFFKEPAKKKEGIELYRTEVYFDGFSRFQEPTFTRLQTIFAEKNQRVEAKVEVIFSEYEFNLDLEKKLTQ